MRKQAYPGLLTRTLDTITFYLHGDIYDFTGTVSDVYYVPSARVEREILWNMMGSDEVVISP